MVRSYLRRVLSSVGNRLERVFGATLRLSVRERILVSLGAVVVAVLAGGVLLLGAGSVASCQSPALYVFDVPFCYNPVEVYWVMLDGAFGDSFSIAATLHWTTLLLFTGLSFAIPYRAGLFNIGAQGQFILGALGATVAVLWAGAFVPTGLAGTLILVPLGLLAGTVVGGLYGLIPGYLKVRFEMNEVITTLLLSFIAADIAFVLVDRFFLADDIQGTVTNRIPEAARLSPVIFPSGTNFSLPVFIFAMVVVAGCYWLLMRTSVGYDIRTVGAQPKAAVFGGADQRFTTLFSMTTAGAVAGLGGAIYVMMILGRWQTGAPPLGFDGIAVSILAGNNPAGLLPSGLLFGTLESGGRAVQMQLGVPSDLIEVLRGFIILLVATPELFRLIGKYLQKRGLIDVETEGRP